MFNALEQRLCQRWNAVHPLVALQSAIKAAFPSLEEMHPPIDMGELARQRRIVKVVLEEMDADGYIYSTTTGDYVVKLNAGHREERRRFTLAHEIGHTFFLELPQHTSSEYMAGEKNIQVFHSDTKEEYLCNRVASEILMPRSLFLDRLDKLGLMAAAVPELAREFGTSLQATARRIWSLTPFNVLISYWQYEPQPDCYKTIWTTQFKNSGQESMLRFCVERTQPVFRSFSEDETFRGWKWMALSGPLQRYFVDGFALRGNPRRLITVVVLDRAAQRLVGPRRTNVGGTGVIGGMKTKGQK